MITLKQIMIKEILAINSEINRIRGVKNSLPYNESYERLARLSEHELCGKLDQLRIIYEQFLKKRHLRLLK